MKPNYRPEELFKEDGSVYRPEAEDSDEKLPF
jgi:hypothetical protein